MSKNSGSKRIQLSSFLIYPFFLILVFALLFFAFNLLFFKKIYPGIYITGVNFSGSSYEDALGKLSAKSNDFLNKQIVLDFDGKTEIVTPSELGVSYDPGETAREAYNIGRSRDYFVSVRDQVRLILNPVDLDVIYRVDFDKFNSKLDSVFIKFEKQPKNAGLVLVGGNFVISGEADGTLVNRSLVYQALQQRLSSLSQTKVDVVLIDAAPRVKQAGVKEAFDKVNMLAKQKIVLTFGFDKWTLGGKELLSMLQFKEKDADFISTSFGQEFNLLPQDSADGKLDVFIDDVRLSKYADSIGEVVEKPTKDATLRFEGGKVIEFSSAQDGQALNKVSLKKTLVEKISIENILGEEIINIQLPVEVTKAKIANEEINSLGIKELIGRGVSYFAGSIPNRIHNLTLGSQLVSGALVKPGEVFSFTSLVGPVSADQGFKQAYVISKGRTVLDDGGGICQVSTTVFRAALNSGLPIVKRTAHAYRVSYYEQNGFKPGMDATIWSPTVDLQFKNDTSHHILVQATVDRSISKLQVDIYGTGDGRKVELGDVKVSNQVPAPEPLYQDDPTLPKGVTKQVDFAAAGATTVFTRKVYKNDELFIDESFRSVFKPWQAVFLVGTAG